MMTNNDATYHVPVMLQECLDGLNINPDGIYVDVTFGGGGHSRAIFEKLSSKGKLIVFDQDPDAKKNAWEAPNFFFVAANFAFLSNHLRLLGIKKVDGILADLGVSSHQFDVPERGFSTRFDSELDMRMTQRNDLTAGKIINEYSEAELRRVLKEYGEVDNAHGIMVAISKARNVEPITSTAQLKTVLDRFLPPNKTNKIMAQIYQALRIEVNQEIQVLKEFLEQTPELLNAGGRLSVISYHSLEDRLVKRYMRDGMFEGQPEKDVFGNINVPFKKSGGLIVPTESEIKINNRARSAKLRIAEKI